nr:Uncharacterised protein [Klebsiella pneumoniae]
MEIINIKEVKTIKKLIRQTGPRRGPVISPVSFVVSGMRKGMLFKLLSAVPLPGTPVS